MTEKNPALTVAKTSSNDLAPAMMAIDARYAIISHPQRDALLGKRYTLTRSGYRGNQQVIRHNLPNLRLRGRLARECLLEEAYEVVG